MQTVAADFTETGAEGATEALHFPTPLSSRLPSLPVRKHEEVGREL